MAAFSASFATTATTLPELIFLSPQNPTKRLKLSLFKPLPRTNFKILGARIKAVQREESAVLEEKDRELETKLNGSVNGNGNGSYGYSNGAVQNYTNGSMKVEKEDGNLQQYVNGNGNGNVDVAVSEEKKVELVKVEGVNSEKKSVEEIGQEEAWFKSSGQDQVEVSVAPGGRWSRFKTYSTIQRTLEIWGFVLTFVFKVWLNNQKFSYRG